MTQHQNTQPNEQKDERAGVYEHNKAFAQKAEQAKEKALSNRS